MRDLGAVVAIHDFLIPVEDMVVVRSIDDFERLLGRNHAPVQKVLVAAPSV
ncbi:hypothetical protein D3C87_2044860 [compost metagenome]